MNSIDMKRREFLQVASVLGVGAAFGGYSIAVNGACLTAESFVDHGFVVIAARETMEKTALRGIRVGQKVHLERAM